MVNLSNAGIYPGSNAEQFIHAALTQTKEFSVEECAAVVDLDNLLHRGFDKQGRARPQAELDILGLGQWLREERGVTCGTVCRNRSFSPFAEALWRQLGFRTLSAGKNCDEAAIQEAKTWADAGVTRLVLLTGDVDFSGLVRWLRGRKIDVDVVAKTRNCSERLKAAANTFVAVDRFLRTPNRNVADVLGLSRASVRRAADCSRGASGFRAPQFGMS